MSSERQVYTGDEHGWRAVPEAPAAGLTWVVVPDGTALRDEARRGGLSEQGLRMLDEHPLTDLRPSPTGPLDDSGRHVRGHVNRSNAGEILLTLPTATYVDASRDVRTGALTCVVTDRVVVAWEQGEAGVLGAAAHKLCGGLPVPDTGTRQVLAAILLTLVTRAADVEAGLGDAVAELEQLVVETPDRSRTADSDEASLGAVYGLKREIAEARRALGPMTSALPELEAEAQEARAADRPVRDLEATSAWLRRVRERSDRVDAHLDAHDGLLDAMLSVHLSTVSVRQNEDMRKISAWAAMITVPTLVAGIYGMNFRYMPELDWRFGYPFALTVMATACGLLYRAFRRSGWL